LKGSCGSPASGCWVRAIPTWSAQGQPRYDDVERKSAKLDVSNSQYVADPDFAPGRYTLRAGDPLRTVVRILRKDGV
jgi:hypothetical protein